MRADCARQEEGCARTLGLRSGVTGRRGRPQQSWDALTRTELQVVELVADRLSNPEIAQRLFLSRRTVETHVSHAFGKLGCASRKDLIAIVLQHRVRDPGRP